MKNFLHEAFLQRTDRPDNDAPSRRSPSSLLFGAIAKPISWIYRVSASADRRFRYPDPIDLSDHTLLVVVSSPVVGGVGKTPLVAHLATQLAVKGHKTAIVASGYGRRSRGHVTLDDSNTSATASQSGDEPFMLRQATGLPVHVDDDPSDAVARLDAQTAPQCIVLDDGIRRRWRGERRIVVLSGYDLECPVRFLPDGRWRIAPRHTWPAAGVAIIEDSPTTDRNRHRETLERWGYRGPIGWYRTIVNGFTRLGETGLQPVDALPNDHPYVFSGLGRPSRFLSQVRALGMTPAGISRFPDHHSYCRGDLQILESACEKSQAGWLLTTHKDAVKIDPAWVKNVTICYLRISLELTAGADMLSVILERAT
jgi:tetraacyldisaccharide 4'-kinase